MTIRNLEHLLAPKSVALIGASVQDASVGLITARNLLYGGFAGPVWLVNPKHGEIEGRPCYPTVAALPAAPELAVIATPPDTVPGLIDELGRRGTRAAVVITAGVRDQLRQKMLDAARPHCLRVQGPNCVGLMVPGLGLNASFSHAPPLKGDLALLSQSGALITAIIDWARGRSIGFSHAISLGDMADVDFGDLLDYLAGDAKQPRHPALHGGSHPRTQVPLGRAPGGAGQARHRCQGRPRRGGRQGRALAYGGARRRRRRLRGGLPPRGRPACARARRPLQRRRDPGAASAPHRRAAGHPHQRRRRRRAGDRPLDRARRPSRQSLRLGYRRTRCRPAANLVARQPGRHHRRCRPRTLSARARGDPR